uniref:MHC class I-like antigen recognition-like domain-containing protein n=1 Tax=Varanus komodoensis TaxID=61221 RepID=A0A8D2JGL2_VARKO
SQHLTALLAPLPDSSPSIFRTVYTAVSEPGPGLPQFTAAAYVDDLPIAHYDSDTGKVWNRAKWMEKGVLAGGPFPGWHAGEGEGKLWEGGLGVKDGRGAAAE